MEPIKIITIDGQKFDTSKMPDLQAELIEKMENSGIREFVQKINGVCFVYAAVPGDSGWSQFNVNGNEDLNKITDAFAQLVKILTKDKFRLKIIPNETQYTGEENV